MHSVLCLCLVLYSAFVFAFGTHDSQNDLALPGKHLNARQGPAVVPATQFLRRSFTASAVAGSWLYIDGGEYSWEANGISNYHFGGTLLSIDLSQSWTNSTVNIQSNPRPNGVPTLVSPSLWYSEKNDVLYTGFTGRTSFFGGPLPNAPITLWSFKPDGSGAGTWNNTINTTAQFRGISRPFAPLQAYGGEIALILGGMANAGTQPLYVGLKGQMALPGVVTFDMASNKFTNKTADDVYGGDGFAVNGIMQYVPSFGSKGVFIAMGGSSQATETPNQLQSFQTVSVYDPAQGKWYNQSTTGDIPLPRLKSCAAGVASSNGTYEILLYGGFGGVLGEAAIPYDDAHILTLPAFHWIKVDSFTAKNPRYGHSCNAVGGSQILSIGGVDANPAIPAPGPDNLTTYQSTLNTTADPFTQGLAIFDMTALNFADSYQANASAYLQSDPVVQYYATNKNKSLDTSGLQTVFQTTNFPPSNTTSSAPPPTSSSSHTGAIVGGVVGGLAGLAIISAGIWFLLRRRIQRDSQQAQGVGQFEEGPTLDKDGLYTGPRYAEMYQTQPAEMEFTTEPPHPAELPGNTKR